MSRDKNALIGHTGFVGGTLLRQASFAHRYNSKNIEEIRGHDFDLIVCAGAPAQKWLANRDPADDLRKIMGLIECLRATEAKELILISTVDVFKDPLGVDEDSVVDEDGLHTYGLHRRLLEKFVTSQFPRHLVVRLPGLVGPGLKKNVIYDFHNDNNLGAIESRGVFQFYPMVNLWWDIERARQAGLQLVHLTAEPVSVADVAQQGFGKAFAQQLAGTPARYDMQTRHAELFGGQGRHQYSARETAQAIRAYAQSEPRASMSQASGA